jgi:hypothetical protein
MSTQTFIGLSVKSDLTPGDILDLKYLGISAVKSTADIWYLYRMPGPQLIGHHYQHFINQLKRVKNHIYSNYNDDFGIQTITI